MKFIFLVILLFPLQSFSNEKTLTTPLKKCRYSCIKKMASCLFKLKPSKKKKLELTNKCKKEKRSCSSQCIKK